MENEPGAMAGKYDDCAGASGAMHTWAKEIHLLISRQLV